MTTANPNSQEEYVACQLSSWYPTFSQPFPERRKGVTLQSRILSVPETFRPYLMEDGVRLPPNTKASSCLSAKPQRAGGDDDDDDSKSWSDDSSADDASPRVPLHHPDLQALTDTLTNTIQELGGSVVPKLNWSTPKDATWINEGTLKCATAGDVYLLLKSSDFCASDIALLDTLNQAPPQSTTTTDDDHLVPLHIVLRKWANLFPSQEFRCFVRQRQLIAVSQRHADQHFEHLPQEKDEFLGLLHDFIEDVILNNFPLSDFVADIYVDKQDRAWILDFNVFGERTDSLLFDWTELREWSDDRESEIRVVETDKEVRPHPLNNFRAPVDTVHIAGITGGNADSFQAFMELCQQQQDDDVYDEDEGDDTNY